MNKIQKLNLTKLNVKIDDLLLDPNNPRFCKHVDEMTPSAKWDTKQIQTEVFRKMCVGFDISELVDSIKSKGFVPVDNIFVKKAKNKYLVVEGNRRITAIKLLLKSHAEGKPKDVLPKEILDTLNKIECFDLTNNGADEIDFILGLRHHGSIKNWDFLPSSFNIYNRYMKALREEKEDTSDDIVFEYNVKIAKIIKSLYSLPLGEVRDKLRAYAVYLQLRNSNVDGVGEKFSIIHDAIKNPTLRKHFNFDEVSCTFDDEGVDNFVNLVYGIDGTDPAITAAASGDKNLRDFAYIVDKGTDEDVRKIYEERQKPVDVKGEIVSAINKSTLISTLDLILKKLTRLEIGGIGRKLSDAETERLQEVKDELEKIESIGK
ncbi:ParB N-terminal domain-containing protein [Candidatus Undinarchaeota archaeon]